jgi:hypothetical protein
VYVRILIFDFVLLHIVCGCLTDIFIFPLFQYCMMDWYLQDGSSIVSICMDMLYLRLRVVNLLIAFVLFRSFAFEKFMLCFVRSIK